MSQVRYMYDDVERSASDFRGLFAFGVLFCFCVVLLYLLVSHLYLYRSFFHWFLFLFFGTHPGLAMEIH